MRFALLTWGSHGDLLPFVALAKQLQREGHFVVLGAPPEHEDFARKHGIRHEPVGAGISRPQYCSLMDRLVVEANPRKQMKLLLEETLLPELESQYTACVEISAGVDVVVSHWTQIAAMLAADWLGRPCATVTLNPVGIGSILRPAAELAGGTSDTRPPERNLGKLLSDEMWGERVHEFRRRMGFAPIDSVSEYQYSKILNLLPISRCFAPHDSAFSAPNVVTGFWRMHEPESELPTAVLDFIDPCDPPIVITFGSMGGFAEQTTEIVLEAIRLVDKPAIIQGGWGRIAAHARALPDRMLRVDYVPHDALFSRAACVVHHGGAGTTSAALASGVPSVVVWHMLDQPYWGALLARHRLGPEPLRRLGLTARSLADRIIQAVSTQEYRTRCAAIAPRLEAEDGVQASCARLAALA